MQGDTFVMHEAVLFAHSRFVSTINIPSGEDEKKKQQFLIMKHDQSL